MITMKQADLRLHIFRLWVLFWIISTIVLILGPWARPDKAINTGQIMPALLSISGIWIPPLTCFATFWFPREEQNASRNIVVTKDRVYAGLTFTVTYMLFVLIVIVWAIYVVDYLPQSDELPVGASFQERLGDSVKMALLVSPLALAPIGWLTGSHVKEREIEQ